jgi:hypothetical protein
MVPSGWLTVVLFLLLVSSGLLFDLLAVRRRTGPAESAFHETSRIVLASLGFTAVVLTVRHDRDDGGGVPAFSSREAR